MIEIVAPIVLLAGLAVALRRLARYGASRPNKGLAIHRLTQPHLDDGDGWHVEYAGIVSVSIWTASLNALPGILLGLASAGGQQLYARQRGNQRRLAALRLGYDLGSVLALGGMLVSMGGAVWAVVMVWKAVWAEFEAHASHKTATHLVKRIVGRTVDGYGGQSTQSGQTSAASGGIQPIELINDVQIPGITVPWSHLPTIALAVLLNQIIHELGHALSGSLDDIQMTKFSLNLHAFLPSATVTFPSGVESLPIRAKLRLAAAGPLHNLLVYLTIGLSVSTGLSHVFWRNQAYEGVVVQSVQPTSPLYGHLQPGNLITHLDDVFLGDRDDLWSHYLHSNQVGDEGHGWCVDRSIYEKMHSPPCVGYAGTVTFEPVDDKDKTVEQRCIATHPILHIPSSVCPCPSSKWICVRPARSEDILRIRLANVGGVAQQGTEGEVVLFAGDRSEVYDGVEVGSYGARFAGPIVRWYTLFLKYMSSIAISLFFLNLLPFPRADGSSLLRFVLALYPTRSAGSSTAGSTSPPVAHRSLQATLTGTPLTSAGVSSRGTPVINLSRQYELNSDDEDEYDPEIGGVGGMGGVGGGRGGSGRREEAWKRRFRRAVEGGMLVLAAGWAVGWMFLGLLRSS